MGIEINVKLIAFFVVITIGVIEWLKSGFKQAPKWVWWLTVPVVSIGSAIIGGGGVRQIAATAGLIWSAIQLGYDLIVQGVIGFIKALVQSFVAKAAQAAPPGGAG